MRYSNNDKSFQEYLMALKWIFVSNFVLNYISQCSFASYKYTYQGMHWLRICLCVFELVRSFTMFYAFFAFEWCALCGFLLARLTKWQLFR